MTNVIRLRRADGRVITLGEGQHHDFAPDISPDGRWIAFIRDNRDVVLCERPEGDSPRCETILKDIFPFEHPGARVSPEGRQVAFFISGRGLQVSVSARVSPVMTGGCATSARSSTHAPCTGAPAALSGTCRHHPCSGCAWMRRTVASWSVRTDRASSANGDLLGAPLRERRQTPTKSWKTNPSRSACLCRPAERGGCVQFVLGQGGGTRGGADPA